MLFRRICFTVVAAVLCVLLFSCGQKEEGSAHTEPAPEDMMIMNVRATDRLYTTEYVVNKAVTYDDIVKLKGTIFAKSFDLTLPQGKRKIIIPMEARLKAYIDFSTFSKDNIVISPDSSTVRIILPDPKVDLTSTRIDHAGILTFVDFGRSRFTQSEISEFERQGRAAIIAAIPQTGIVETARRDAYALLLPLVEAMGFGPEQITVEFRSDFSSDTYLQPLINSLSRD